MSGLPEYPGAGGAVQEPPAAATGQNGKAVASLVLGICGIVLCPLILSVPALVVGYQSRREIDASGGRQTGRGMATAGIVLGWVGIVVAILGILLVIGAGAVWESGDGGSSETSTGMFEVEPNAILARLPF